MGRPVECRLDERAAGGPEALTTHRVLEEIVDRVAKLDGGFLKLLIFEEVFATPDVLGFRSFGITATR